jgi:hydrophobic/amphiphilic exporter-1 (mainly G- bacteria), HAE1 family
MHGVVGRYFKPFGLTVAIAVFASLLVARLFTPVLAAYFLNVRAVPAEPVAGWLPLYRRWLDLSLARPKSSLAAAGGVLALTLLLLYALPVGFLPNEDSDVTHVSLIPPPGSSVADSDRLAQRLTARLRAAAPLQPDIRSIFTLSTHHVALMIRLRPDRPDTRLVFEERLRRVLDRVPDLDWHMSDNGDARDVELDFTGDDPVLLNAAMNRLASAAASLRGLSHVQTTMGAYTTEITITPKAALAATLGVSSADLAGTLLLAAGTLLPNAPVVSGPDGQTPLRLSVQGGANAATLGETPVQSASGTTPLALVAAIGIQPGPAQILRADGAPMEGIGADLLPGTTLGQAVAELHGLPAYRALSAQRISELDLGAAEFMQEMFTQLRFAMGSGVLVLLGVMLLLFRNWLQPLTILATLPLSVAGALLALLLFGFALDLSSAIGLLTLLGIVTKNAILIVDAALAGERAGLTRVQAARAAGLRRARPVVMTTLAMIAGMIPVTLVSGAGASLRLPMAVALIGGLSVATIFSLIFVPVFYVRIGHFTDRLAPLLSRMLTAKPEDFT